MARVFHATPQQMFAAAAAASNHNGIGNCTSSSSSSSTATTSSSKQGLVNMVQNLTPQHHQQQQLLSNSQAILTPTQPFFQTQTAIYPQDFQPDRPIGYGAFGVVWLVRFLANLSCFELILNYCFSWFEINQLLNYTLVHSCTFSHLDAIISSQSNARYLKSRLFTGDDLRWSDGDQ
jgi:hypothetical protein